MKRMVLPAALACLALAAALCPASSRAAATPEEVDRLNFAIADNDMDRVLDILASGMDINAWNEVGLTPLAYAVETFRDPEILTLLLERGAIVNTQMPRTGSTVLIKAAGSPTAYVVVSLLLSKGADPAIVDKQGVTALWSALGLLLSGEAEDRDLALENVRLLLEAGADPNLPLDGLTPVMSAAQAGEEDAVRLLAEHNASMLLTTADNLTALDLALAGEYAEVAAFLAEWAANSTETAPANATLMLDLGPPAPPAAAPPAAAEPEKPDIAPGEDPDEPQG